MWYNYDEVKAITFSKVVKNLLEEVMEKMNEKLALVGRKIKFLRIERHITQTGLAEQLDLSQTHLSNIENGKTVVTLQTLFKLSELFNCKVADFFTELDKAEGKQDDVTVENAMKLLRMIKGL